MGLFVVAAPLPPDKHVGLCVCLGHFCVYICLFPLVYMSLLSVCRSLLCISTPSSGISCTSASGCVYV